MPSAFRLSSCGGFTLIELMIAAVIGMIVVGAVYTTYISQQRSFVVQDQVAEMNSTSKIALDMIVNGIREAGFAVPEAGTYNINGFTNVITATDSTAAPDSITIIGGYRHIGYIAADVSSGETILKLKDCVTCAGFDASKLNTQDRRHISIVGLSYAEVIGISGNDITIQSGIDKSFLADVPVYLVEDTTYQVVGMQLQRVRRLNCAAFGGGPNCEDMDVITENVEDFQIAYGYDTNDNGTIEPAEFIDVPPATDRLRRIRINILACTARGDPNIFGQGNPPVVIENRNHVATNDGLRRRWWRMEVDLRNPV